MRHLTYKCHVSFCFSLIFPRTVFLDFICIARCAASPLLLTTVWCSLMGVLHFLSVHFPCDGHPNPLQLPVTTNYALVSMHVPLETREKIGMGHIPRDCIAGPQAMSIFNVTKYYQIALECPKHTTFPPAEAYPYLSPADTWHYPAF